MNLVIVESPTKARTLSRYLGGDYRIEASLGHVRDLPKSKLGIDVEHDFTPQYVLPRDKNAIVRQIKEAAKTADKIILATDPDREGEAIAYHLGEVISSNSKLKTPFGPSSGRGQNSKLVRIVFHEITEGAIKEALTHPRQIDMQLVHAQQARRVLDRLVGYKLSPLLWYKVRKGLSAGRVQSVALRLIAEREREIDAFKPVEYWVIEIELQKKEMSSEGRVVGDVGQFIAKLTEKDGVKIEVNNKEQADQIVSELEKASYQVANIDKKEARRFPYPPFTTSTLQQAGANRFGWSARKTMRTAQALYEVGFITYHRTDSTNIATVAISMVRDYINKVYGQDYLPDQPKFYKTKSKVAQEAHEAIRPTKLATSNYQLATNLGRDADRLLDLITKRFVACQMKEAVYDQTAVDISAGNYKLRANGSMVKFDGWLAVYGKQKENPLLTKDGSGEVINDGEKDMQLPPLEVNENLKLVQLLPQQKFTEPPPRYNEASLIKTLEEKGIGRPSTYAPTISTILDRQYVEKLERRFHPTALGLAVNDFLVTNFPNIVDYDFTARLEDQLDSIANGQEQWVPIIRAFYTPFSQQLDITYKEAERVKIAVETLAEKCPQCGNPLVVRLGRFGKFIACSTYPACKYTRPYIEKAGFTCPKCGSDVVIRKTRQGRVFYGCESYPKCNYAVWKKPVVEKGQVAGSM